MCTLLKLHYFSYISISVPSILFNLCYIPFLLCYSYVCLHYNSCLHYVCTFFWTGSSCHQDKFLVCKHTCNKALLILLVLFLTLFCCHHVPRYMAFCRLAPRLHSIQCQMIVCDIKKLEVSRNTPKHKHV